MYMHMVETRTEQFILRIAPSERAMLDRLAEADGLSAADVVRVLVKRAHDERFGAKAPKQGRKS